MKKWNLETLIYEVIILKIMIVILNINCALKDQDHVYKTHEKMETLIHFLDLSTSL